MLISHSSFFPYVFEEMDKLPPKITLIFIVGIDSMMFTSTRLLHR
jgi:hypothetical protein